MFGKLYLSRNSSKEVKREKMTNEGDSEPTLKDVMKGLASIKSTVDGINNRLGGVEERISKVEEKLCKLGELEFKIYL